MRIYRIIRLLLMRIFGIFKLFLMRIFGIFRLLLVRIFLWIIQAFSDENLWNI